MSSDPKIGLVEPLETRERNWLPLAIAAGVVLIVAAVVIFALEHGHKPPTVAPVTAALDPYASSLAITNLVMSESSNLAGGKVTYIDGHIANQGAKTISGISVQILFRTFAKEVTQNETQSLQFVRTRDPYVDLEPVSAAPLKPGDSRDFRLIFDRVSPDWDGAYPEIRILHTDAQ